MLDGRLPAAHPSTVLRGGAEDTVTDAVKAQVMAESYRGRSTLREAEEGATRAFHRRIGDEASRSVKDEGGEGGGEPTGMDAPFIAQELDAALRAAKKGTAAGADGIPYEFLCHAGPRARARLLDMINLSWARAEIPPEWRHSTIVPLPKRGQRSTQRASYRPVALTATWRS